MGGFVQSTWLEVGGLVQLDWLDVGGFVQLDWLEVGGLVQSTGLVQSARWGGMLGTETMDRILALHTPLQQITVGSGRRLNTQT